ncbi:sensor histidine kinase [Geoalkalibacter ferrihydriticus]|nr:sensor histidine kinase [Geoalkalibacter ferrihydriticus]
MIRLLLILMLLPAALPCAMAAQSVILNPAPTILVAADLPQDLHGRMDYLLDPDARMTPEEALESADWQPLQQLNFGYLGYPVWTRVTLAAEAEPMDVLLQLKRMALIDLYLIHPETQVVHYQLGHRQVLDPAAIRYRFPVLPLHLESGRPVTLLTRIYCIGPIEVGSRISSAADILHQDTREHLIWGAICGMMIAVVLSSLIIWHGFRQRLVLAYAAIALTSLLAIVTVKGLIPLTPYPALNSLGVYSSWVFSNLMPVTMIVFAMVFFATKETLPLLHRWLALLLGVNLVLTAAWLAAPWYPLLYRYTALLGGTTFLTGIVLTGVGLVGLRRGISGSGYYLLGQGSFFLSLQFQLLGQFGLLQRQEILDFVIPVGATLDIVFLAQAMSLRLSAIKKEIHQRRREFEQRSRESSFGKMVGMVIHQWRAPLARQAAMVMETKLRLTRNSQARQDLERFTAVLLPRMRDNVEQMEKTRQEFEALFSENDKLLRFNPDCSVAQALSVVSGTELPAPLRTLRHRPEDLKPILNYPFALTQVILTLIENACDIMRERRISNPEINISLSQAADMSVTITVCDNGGGITLSPASRLFDPFVSGKRQPGTGMGLYIAKLIVESRLRGTITAAATRDGARFTLTIPDRMSVSI